MSGARGSADLLEIARRRFRRSTEVPLVFFEANADAIARACLEMARRFQRGGRLLVFGEGAEATDAQHVAVEFVHPVLVGKRALPALALTSDVAALTGFARETSLEHTFARELEVLGREKDVALGIARGDGTPPVRRGLDRARELGMLTVALFGQAAEVDGHAAGDFVSGDFVFTVPSSDPLVVQEVHETLCHVLWELVHVFFENRVVA